MKIKPPKTFKLTPQAAKKLLQLNTYEGQRPPSPTQLEDLKQRQRDGLYHTAQVAVANLREGKRRLLLNGQKSCMVAVEEGVTLNGVMTEFDCETMAEVARAFAQFDSNARTPAQKYWAYACAAGLERYETLGRQAIGQITSALSLWHYYDEPRVQVDKRAELLLTYTKLVRELHELLYREKAKTAFLRRAPVMAAMLDGLNEEPEKAREFWSSVRSGAGLAADDPRLRLRDYLQTAKLGTSRRLGAGGVAVDQHGMLATCLDHWNAWLHGYPPRDGRGVKKVVWTSEYLAYKQESVVATKRAATWRKKNKGSKPELHVA